LKKRVPMTRLRATIAKRLVEAQQTAALLTTYNEVNMGPIMELRKKYKKSSSRLITALSLALCLSLLKPLRKRLSVSLQ